MPPSPECLWGFAQTPGGQSRSGRVSPRAHRTDPYGRNSRIRLPSRVFDGEAFVGPRMCNVRLWKPSISQYVHSLPHHFRFLAAREKRAPPYAGDIKSKVPERCRVDRNRAISIEAHRVPPQPRPLRID